MENITLEQTYLFLVYIISGMLIGILFDIFRVLRKSFNTKDFFTYIEDIIFWIITGLFLIFVIFRFNNGEIRGYSICGILLGIAIYIFSISKIFIKINVKIITFLKKIITYIYRFVIRVIKKLFSPFTFFVINIKKIALKFIKNEKISKKNK